jgi:multidrug efflux pump subunit AcrA (membrane-fusion protein)
MLTAAPSAAAKSSAAKTQAAAEKSQARLERQAHKAAIQLAKFKTGSYLEYDFRNAPPVYGSLGQLSEATFQYTDSDNNKVQTRAYADLAGVKRAKAYIGDGLSRHRHVRLWVPVTVGALVAGGAVAAYEETR